jgi:hypothetical protein
MASVEHLCSAVIDLLRIAAECESRAEKREAADFEAVAVVLIDRITAKTPALEHRAKHQLDVLNLLKFAWRMDRLGMSEHATMCNRLAMRLEPTLSTSISELVETAHQLSPMPHGPQEPLEPRELLEPQLPKMPQVPQELQVPEVPQELQVPEVPQELQVPEVPQELQVPQIVERYFNCRGHQGKGDLRVYQCHYCGTRKRSRSTAKDRRVRIRCLCGGRIKQTDVCKTGRLHARWRLVQ